MLPVLLLLLLSHCFLWTTSQGYKLTPVAECGTSGQITREELKAITRMLVRDNVYLPDMPESPYLRIGFHIAASYDKELGQGGWNELPSRATMREEGLMDDILIVYWDVLEEYWTSKTTELHGMTKADFMSYVIYMFSKSGIFTPNVTWRAGRSPSRPASGEHMKSGRPALGEGLSRSFKPDADMTTPSYLREYFSRLNFDDDRDVALLLTAHALGSARGMPYLGEFASSNVMHQKHYNHSSLVCGVGACYFWDMLNLDWEVGCPETCSTCLWGWTQEKKAKYNKKDPYNTTWANAPSNYTNASAWGDACTHVLEKEGLFEYRDSATRSTMRLPAEMALLHDASYKKIMTLYVDNLNDDKTYALDFARAYSKMLEVGVPEGQLYSIEDLEGSTPPFRT